MNFEKHIIRIDHFYCIKKFNYKTLGNFQLYKTYKAIFYTENTRYFITIIDEDNYEVDFKVKSMLHTELIPQYLIPIKDARKQKLKKLYETINQTR